MTTDQIPEKIPNVSDELQEVLKMRMKYQCDFFLCKWRTCNYKKLWAGKEATLPM